MSAPREFSMRSSMSLCLGVSSWKNSMKSDSPAPKASDGNTPLPKAAPKKKPTGINTAMLPARFTAAYENLSAPSLPAITLKILKGSRLMLGEERSFENSILPGISPEVSVIARTAPTEIDVGLVELSEKLSRV